MTHFSKLFTRTSRFVIFMVLMAFFLFLCVKVLDFFPSEMPSEEFTTTTTFSVTPVTPLRPTKAVEPTTVLSTTATPSAAEATEPPVVIPSTTEEDGVVALEQRIDNLLKEFDMNVWLKLMTEPLYKLEGDTLTKDMYDSGFSDPNAMLCVEMGDLLRVVILITSSPQHFRERQSIRETWGQIAREPDVALGFIVGATLNETLESELEEESTAHGDLIRGNSIDSYSNLTLKSLSMLEWTLTFCPMTPYLLKTDDDMFLNMGRLLPFLEDHSQDTRRIFGRIARNLPPHRNSDSKWYLPEDTFRHYVYPNFAFGPLYILTGDVMLDIYEKALETPFVWLEDVFLTGFVAEELKIPRQDLGEVIKRGDVEDIPPCRVEKAMALHEVKPSELFDFWKILSDPDIHANCTALAEQEEREALNQSIELVGEALKNLMNEILGSKIDES